MRKTALTVCYSLFFFLPNRINASAPKPLMNSSASRLCSSAARIVKYTHVVTSRQLSTVALWQFLRTFHSENGGFNDAHNNTRLTAKTISRAAYDAFYDIIRRTLQF